MILFKTMVCRFVLITMVFLFLSFKANADIGFQLLEGNKVLGVRILISGTIVKKDLDELNLAVKKISEHVVSPLFPHYIFYLDTEGGELDSAIGIGKIIRDLGALVRVEKHSQCLSSCVFILAGGASRFVQGIVGIHRPYDPSTTDSSVAGVRARYEQLSRTAKTFLKDVNIEVSLYETMMRTPPESMKLLSPKELEYFGLSVDDPYIDEARSIAAAKRMGITRVEYARRIVRAEKICGSLLEMDSDFEKSMAIARCHDDVMTNNR